MYYSANEIRNIWINFFESKQHLFIKPASLIPNNDPSLLWINSGVATLKPYFTGASIPPSNRLVNVQKSIRTNDIENVGLTSRHHTFFEMLGNFSIGDYFKNEAIEFGFELLTKKFNFFIEKLYVTVYIEDTIAYDKWISLGIKKEHIIKGDKNRNFWDIGQGPCGPCTEIFYDRGNKYDPNNVGERLFFEDLENDRYVEIWNIVFSEFNNNGNGNYNELKRKNIDTGAGLERLSCILQDTPTNFDTDLFLPIINELSKLTPYKYDANSYFTNDVEQNKINTAYRIIIDHIKANVFAIADGAIPSNKERGSVLRKLIRRAMVYGQKINVQNGFVTTIALSVIENMKGFYPYLIEQSSNIIDILNKEVSLFENTLGKGYKLFNESLNNSNILDGKTVFHLVDTYGFPFEIIKELASQRNVKVDDESFFKHLAAHKEISKSNTNVVGMDKQNIDLIEFTIPSTFDYDNLSLHNSKIIGMFDQSLNRKYESSSKIYLIFDKTPFYATSGGQSFDHGNIIINNVSFPVLDVIKSPNGQHLHLIDLNGNTVNVNDTADLIVDKQYRLDVSRNHTTEHILEFVMNSTIDKSIKQEGAFKSNEYFTFDFKYPSKLTQEQLTDIELNVNKYIKSNSNILTTHETYEEAKAANAVGHFSEVYSKISGKLRVVNIGSFNKEICGGTHVNNTSEIEQFIITKYTSKGAGQWRIEAITGKDNINKYIDEELHLYSLKLEKIKTQLFELKIDDKELNELIKEVDLHSSAKNLLEVKNKFVKIEELFNSAISLANKNNEKINIANIKSQERKLNQSQNIYYAVLHNYDIKTVQSALKELINEDKTKCFVFVLLSELDIKYISMVNSSNIVNCKELINKINLLSNGKGGGNDIYAQGSTKDINSIDQIINLISEQ